jgi:hypothetical protein
VKPKSCAVDGDGCIFTVKDRATSVEGLHVGSSAQIAFAHVEEDIPDFFRRSLVVDLALGETETMIGAGMDFERVVCPMRFEFRGERRDDKGRYGAIGFGEAKNTFRP